MNETRATTIRVDSEVRASLASAVSEVGVSINTVLRSMLERVARERAYAAHRAALRQQALHPATESKPDMSVANYPTTTSQTP